MFLQEIEDKEKVFLGIKKSTPQNLLSNESHCSYFCSKDVINEPQKISSIVINKTTEKTRENLMEKKNENLEIFERNLQRIEIPKEDLKIPLINVNNTSETNILRRLRNLEKLKSSLLDADEYILREASPSSPMSPNKSFGSNLESLYFVKTNQVINSDKHSNNEKKKILDMVQKAKYVLINIFYLSHYNKVMNLTLPSSKNKLNNFRDLESSPGLSPIFRQIQRGESPRNRSWSQEWNSNLNSQIMIDENQNLLKVLPVNENDSVFYKETELINDLRILEKNEKKLNSDQGRKMMFLIRTMCLANSEKLIEERKDIFEKYLIWKTKKWSNLSKK